MKVAVIGASGNVGKRIVAELLSRGHQVTGIARNPGSIEVTSGLVAVAGDATEPSALAKTLAGHDAVVSAVRFKDGNPANLIDAVRASGVRRYFVVGGAASLEVAPGVRHFDTPHFPAVYKAEAAAGIVFLHALKGVDDLDWTFLSPAAAIGPGERTAKFKLGRDNLISTDGKSFISYEDYAVAAVDELEKPEHIRQRFTLGY